MESDEIKARLRELPLRAIVAFAARCARRVQPLTRTLSENGQVVVDQAIAIAEFVATQQRIDSAAADAAARAVDAEAAGAEAAYAAGRAADAAAFAAYAEAAYAADAAADTAEAAFAAAYVGGDALDAAHDLDKLTTLNLGEPGTLGEPVDPSESGPLGPLWPDGAPEWYTNPPNAEDDRGFDKPAPSIVIAWDPDVLSPSEYAELVKALGDLARAEGGLGIQRLRSRGYGVPCESGVPR